MTALLTKREFEEKVFFFFFRFFSFFSSVSFFVDEYARPKKSVASRKSGGSLAAKSGGTQRK